MEPNTTIPPVQKQEPAAQKPLENTAGATSHSHESIGPIVGSLIIVILLIVAALYIWAQKVSDEEVTPMAPAPAASVVVEEKLTAEQTTAVQETGLDIQVDELEDLNF
jgi:hypothetical protein